MSIRQAIVRLSVAIIVLIILFSVSAFGTTIYDDNAPGNCCELPSSGFPLVGTLGPGVWTVSGVLATAEDFDLNKTDPDGDTFSVKPASGYEIISERIQFQFTGSNNSITEPINGTTIFSGNFDQTLTPITPITGVMNIGLVGTPRLVCTGPGGTPPCAVTSPGYSVTFTVDAIPTTSAVPEPSSLALLGSGLAGICGLISRRLRSA